MGPEDLINEEFYKKSISFEDHLAKKEREENIICPYCDYINKKWHDYKFADEWESDREDGWCARCKKDFEFSMKKSVRFESFKKE